MCTPLPHDLSIPTGQTGDGESQEGSDSTEPADRGSDMGGERELAKAGVIVIGDVVSLNAFVFLKHSFSRP